MKEKKRNKTMSVPLLIIKLASTALQCKYLTFLREGKRKKKHTAPCYFSKGTQITAD